MSSAGGGSPPSSNVGLGYAIAIALCFLVLLSALLLASYVWCRAASPRNRRTGAGDQSDPGPNEGSTTGLPRVLFIAEEEEEEGAGGRRVPGLDPAVIRSYPQFAFSKGAPKGAGDGACPICLCEYGEGEMVREMPECRHRFHLTCIDAWLRLNASCPVCRTSPMPTPLSTPLSELVPLSQFAADRDLPQRGRHPR